MSTGDNMERARVFGLWLRMRREADGKSQSDVAVLAGVSRAYIARLENAAVHYDTGRPTTPSREVVDKLAHALGVPVAEARVRAGYAPPPTDDSPVVSLIRSYAEELPLAYQQMLLDFVAFLHQRLAEQGGEGRAWNKQHFLPQELIITPPKQLGLRQKPKKKV